MKLSFFGAAREVTGSCYCIEINEKKFLIDCGMQQGEDEKENQKLPFDASSISFVILTHAHIDHSGRLPLLVKKDFSGKIYATLPTCKLISIMLKDSAHIQEMDTKWENKRRKRAGKSEILPLYNTEDVENTLKHLIKCSYNELIEIENNIKFRFVDAGHILGSASVELFLKEHSVSKKIVFSGDIGNIDQPIIKDPQYIDLANYIVMEATYGDRIHKDNTGFIKELANVIDKTLNRGGNVIIPSFAVGRTQGLLYYIREIKKNKLVSNINFEVYVDSPLAAEATDLYDDDLFTYGDKETKEMLKKGINPMLFPGLKFTHSADDSKALNFDLTPKVIISSSGMCEGGRIRHHLKHNLWREECTIIFVGYQAKGTLGRMILDGAKSVTIFGEEIAVRADIVDFTFLSAHADRNGLLKWINSFDKKPEKVFVTHAENSVAEKFASTLNDLGFKAIAPLYMSTYDLDSGELVK